ncbi:MAG: [protein-PII] uridylyltransferase [Rhodobacteraceae bacterium]|nr:[protein-PII] uridylyltransferase [Paracoccaceae bacterium]
MPQEASAALDSDPGSSNPIPLIPQGDLLCLPQGIFDTDSVLAEIDFAAGHAPDQSVLRSETVRILRDAKDQGRAGITRAFEAKPFAARAMRRSYSHLTDGLILAALHCASQHLHPMANPTPSERISVIAVGGYGRGEMAPYSDADLLFLNPYKITAWTESVIESMLYILWDVKLRVSHSSRAIKDCIRLGRENFTIRTSMLENRFLAGYAPLADELTNRLKDDLFFGTGREFTEAKLEERERRHQRQGQRYMVEPNVKEGKGGLRDLQSLYWIAKYILGADQEEELVELGVFTTEDYRKFRAAEDFLWAVRGHLHLVTGRANEKLSFDLQLGVARRMGYQDRAGRRQVEVFMQDYFRHATAVGDLTRIFLTKLEATHAKSEPFFERLFRRTPSVNDEYQVVHGRLGIADPDAFLADKLNLLRLFEEGLRTGMLIHPDAMLLVTAHLDLIDTDMRKDPEAQRIFLDLLLKHGDPERALRRMNELGVLSAFIPEFKPIVAMMQFNMYHSYTVDEHIIQCIAELAKLEKGQLVDDLPVSTDILKEGVNRKVLYVALLLHDIAKGRPESHSILGAQIAHKVAPRLGLSKSESETVEWLVRYHLLMSDMAQKRDIADPRTVRDFCKAVQSVKRLNLLTVLTVCDIRGVGPDVWNNWKAALIRALYRQARRALETGMEDLNRKNRGAEAKRLLRDALPDWPEAALRHEMGRHYAPYWQGLHVTAHVTFARLLRELDDLDDPAEMRIDLHPDEDRDATRTCFVMADYPGIFARLAGALALVGANVVDARSYITKDGFVTNTYWIQDADGNPYKASRLHRLTRMISHTLKGDLVATEELKSRDKVKKRERAFNVPTHVSFDNEGSDIYTIIEVDTRDRPGLLYDLARTLAHANVNVANAVIATYGEQAVDVFYVKDMFGLKYHSKSKQKSLEAKLRQAITDGAEHAGR